MKQRITILNLCLLSLMAGAQEVETIALGDGFGEIEVRDNTLYRGGTSPEVVSYDLNDTNFTPTTIAVGPGQNPHLRFAVDDEELEVYLSEFDGALFAAPIEGVESTLIQQGATLGEVEILGLDLRENEVYFVTTAPQILKFDRSDPDSTLEVVYEPEGIFPVFNLSIEGTMLYYGTQDSFEPPFGYQVFSLDLTASSPAPQLVTTLPERAWSLAITDNILYLGGDQNNSIYRKNLGDGTTEEAALLVALDLEPDTNLFSIDVEGDFIYYSSAGDAGGIYRIAFEDLAVNDLVTATHYLFPNPAQDHVQILNLQQPTPYIIYNTLGQAVSKGATNGNGQFEISGLGQGMYHVQLQNGTTLKMIKQ